MRNLAPTLSLNRRANRWKSIGFLVLAFGAFLTAVSVLMEVVQLVGRTDPAYGVYSLVRGSALVIGVGALLAGVAMLVRAFTWRKDNDLAQKTAIVLGQALDDRFTFIRNVNKPNIGYIDAVLVGTPGVLVLRIVDVTGDWVNEGANWLIRKTATGEFLPAPFNPTQQVLDDILKLDAAVRAAGISEVPIFGAVVFTEDERQVRLSAREPALPISHLHLLTVNLGSGFLAADRMTVTTAAQVIRLLYGG